MKKMNEIYNVFANSTGICIDSRKVIKKSIFFALKGESFDGNFYAKRALELGCDFAVIDDPVFISDNRYILVEDVLACLQQLAQYHRSLLKIPVIGITGTNGKTTTKELITSVLSQKFSVLATKGNYNNHIGVPLTVLSIKNEHQIAVVEMGANHPGEIAQLCDIARPTHGIITNVGKAHLEGFNDIDTIAKTKSALYESIKRDNGIVMVNKNDELLNDLSNNLNRIFYSDVSGAEVSAVVKTENPFLTFELTMKNQSVSVESKLYGSFNIYNYAAAACVGYVFDVDLQLIKKALEEYVPTNNRSQFIKTPTNHLFLDAYNANPTSMSLAIRAFANQTFAKKAVIIGDMKELGDCSEDEHKTIIRELENFEFEHIILVGEEFYKFENERFVFFENVELLMAHLLLNPIKDAGILIKASRSIGLEKIVSMLNC